MNLKPINPPVDYIRGEENCFNIAFNTAIETPSLRLQGGIFIAFDHKNKFWDGLYMNHYWCITQDNKIVDNTKHLWSKHGKMLDFEIQLPKGDDTEILIITDSVKQLQLIKLLQTTDAAVIAPYRHSRAFGNADLVYMPGAYFNQEQIPGFITKLMDEQGYFTVLDVIVNQWRDSNIADV